MSTLDVVPPSAEPEQRRDLRRMKSFATALLVAAAVVYVLARRAEDGGPAWVGYLRAAAEAAMVGALADWFAVTALFRHPLGLPIPHTAIIPTRKDVLGASLGDFVGHELPVRAGGARQAAAASRSPRRLGGWLAEPDHARRVTAELATAAARRDRRCCATRTCARCSSRSWCAGCWTPRSARRWAGC